MSIFSFFLEEIALLFFFSTISSPLQSHTDSPLFQVHCHSLPCTQLFYIFWLFLFQVFPFFIKILVLLLFLVLLVPLFNIFNIFFQIVIFFYNRIVTLIRTLQHFFLCQINVCFLFQLFFLYSFKFFWPSSSRKLICSFLICWVDHAGLNFLFNV